jgi:hypothetical protein
MTNHEYTYPKVTPVPRPTPPAPQAQPQVRR